MSRYLVRIGTKYLLWSNIVDAPVTNLLTRQRMDEELAQRYGDERLIERLYKNCRAPEDVAYNRAGPEESCLTIEEITCEYADDGS